MLSHLFIIGMQQVQLLYIKLFHHNHSKKLRNGLPNLNSMQIIKILLSILPATNPIWKIKEEYPKTKPTNLQRHPKPNIFQSLPKADPISTNYLDNQPIKFIKSDKKIHMSLAMAPEEIQELKFKQKRRMKMIRKKVNHVVKVELQSTIVKK